MISCSRISCQYHHRCTQTRHMLLRKSSSAERAVEQQQSARLAVAPEPAEELEQEEEWGDLWVAVGMWPVT